MDHLGDFLDAISAISRACGIVLVGSATGSLRAVGLDSGIQLQITWVSDEEGDYYTIFGAQDAVPTQLEGRGSR
jgi:hypothetical protein